MIAQVNNAIKLTARVYFLYSLSIYICMCLCVCVRIFVAVKRHYNHNNSYKENIYSGWLPYRSRGQSIIVMKYGGRKADMMLQLRVLYLAGYRKSTNHRTVKNLSKRDLIVCPNSNTLLPTKPHILIVSLPLEAIYFENTTVCKPILSSSTM